MYNIITKKAMEYSDGDGVSKINIYVCNKKIRVDEWYTIGDDFLIDQLEVAKSELKEEKSAYIGDLEKSDDNAEWFSIHFSFMNNPKQVLIDIGLRIIQYHSDTFYHCELSIECDLETILDFIEEFKNVLEDRADKAVLFKESDCSEQ